jgi:hypothetical protein
LVSRVPCHVVQIPAKTASGQDSAKANHVGVFFGLVSAYSQNDVHGTTQRFGGHKLASDTVGKTLRKTLRVWMDKPGKSTRKVPARSHIFLPK